MNPSPRRGQRYLSVTLAHIRLARGGRRILKGLDWTIRPGQRWLLQGANGAGKTQLLKLIAGDVWPLPGTRSSRRYRWRDEVHSEPQGVKQEIAYVGAERQDRYEHYEWNHRVLTVVGTGLHRSDIPLQPLTAAQRAKALRLLQRFGVAALAQRRFLTLSQGERRLVLLARALAWRPALLLLDEPLNGLDADNRTRVLAALGTLRRSGLPWIFASHRTGEVPAGVTHRALLRDGRVRVGRWRARAVAPDVPDARVRAGRVAATARAVSPAPREPRRSSRTWIEMRNAWIWRGQSAVVRRLSMRIDDGECWVVHGANGSGKSTLLAALHGDLGVGSQGSLWRRGHGAGQALTEFQQRVGCVAPELQAQLPRRSSALDAVVAGLRGAYRLDGAASLRERRAAGAALRRVGAVRHASQPLGDLSYGQMRRVLFARALVRHPDILLLDEPYTGLDAATRTGLKSLVDGYLMQHRTLVIASHHRDEWPRAATHELELARGRVRYCGPLRASTVPGRRA